MSRPILVGDRVIARPSFGSASCGAEPAVEFHVERVECFLPAVGPPDLALAGRVEGEGGQVDALECALLVREVPGGVRGPPVAGVDRLDGVRAADHRADLAVEGEEGYELGPDLLPPPGDHRVLLAPGPVELRRGPAGGLLL